VTCLSLYFYISYQASAINFSKEFDITVVMHDGVPSLPISPAITIIEDSSTLQSVTIAVSNAIHQEESIVVMEEGLPGNISVSYSADRHSVTLSGMTSPLSYATAVSQVSYSYPRMESILESALEGNDPDFTPRTITVQATDGEATEGPMSVTMVTFNRTCSVWRDTSGTQRRVLRVPLEFPNHSKLGLCTAIGIGRLEIVDSLSITSLEFLGNITLVQDLTIAGLGITDLHGLENLGTLASEFSIWNNQFLTTLSQLGANLPANYSTSIRNLAIRDNPSLVDVEGLRILSNITGLLSIQNSPSLRDFSGFDNLREVGTIVIAYLRNRATVLDGFNSLFEAGRIIVTFNMHLEQIAGFQGLRYLEALQITSNPLLRSIDGLAGIVRLRDVILIGNPNLCYILNEFSDVAYWTERLPPGMVSLNMCVA